MSDFFLEENIIRETLCYREIVCKCLIWIIVNRKVIPLADIIEILAALANEINTFSICEARLTLFS